MSQYQDEIKAYLERARESIQAAEELQAHGHYDFAASRAYYAVFYAASAVLLDQGIEVGKHSGVIALMHQRFVKTGKIDKEHGKSLNWLFELRSIGDYGGTTHISQETAEQAVKTASDLVEAIVTLMTA